MSSQKRARSESPTESKVYRSQEIKDRESVFIGHFSPTLSAKALQAQPEIASASHRIAAWRKPSSQASILPGAPPVFETGSDDDGEKWAGKKLEKVLQEERIEGALVVARWYGGIMLGPARFTWIEQCARNAIAASRAARGDEQTDKKRKTADDERDRTRLLEDLPERDKSIVALRQLLRDKTEPSSTPGSSPAKPAHYNAMTVDVLRRLEKARDSTISVLLKRIDEADAKAEQ